MVPRELGKRKKVLKKNAGFMREKGDRNENEIIE